MSLASSFNDPFDCSFTTDIQIYNDYFIRKPILDFLKAHIRLEKADITRIEIAENPLQAARTVLAHHCCHLGDEIEQVVSLNKFAGLLQNIFLV